MSSLQPYHAGWRKNKNTCLLDICFFKSVFDGECSTPFLLPAACISASFLLHCVTDVQQWSESSCLFFRHQLAWTCTLCSQTFLSPCSRRAVVWTCGRMFGALCHPLQLKRAGQTVPVSHMDHFNESTEPNLSRPQLRPPCYSNISQTSRVHLIPYTIKEKPYSYTLLIIQRSAVLRTW